MRTWLLGCGYVDYCECEDWCPCRLPIRAAAAHSLTLHERKACLNGTEAADAI
jgi:hypothetical protein